MVFVVHECRQAALSSGNQLHLVGTAAGGLLCPLWKMQWAEAPVLCWRLDSLFTSSHYQGRATEP